MPTFQERHLNGATGHGKIEYKWIVLSVVTLGALLAAIDSSIVILALPSIMNDLSANMVTAMWVLMGYILMNTIFLIIFGRLADLLGRVRMYNLGFMVFTVVGALRLCRHRSGTGDLSPAAGYWRRHADG